MRNRSRIVGPRRIVQNNATLQCLDVSHSQNFNLEAIQAFVPALESSRLRELHLHSCIVRIAGIRLIIDALVGNTYMQVLNLGSNSLTAADLPDIERLLESTNLRKLDIGFHRIFNGGIVATMPPPHLFTRDEPLRSRVPHLKELILFGTNIGDADICHIANALEGNSTMEWLDLRLNDITWRGLADVARLIVSTRLKHVDFIYRDEVFDNNEIATQQFINRIITSTTLEQIPGIDSYTLRRLFRPVASILGRNKSLAQVALLLAPPQLAQQQRGILIGIVRPRKPFYDMERHKLTIRGVHMPALDRQTLDRLVNFLNDRDSHQVTELVLDRISLVSHPNPDGGLEVLRSFFARSDTVVTKVTLCWCHFGSHEDTVRLIEAFQTNRIITDFTIQRTHNLEGAALGACLSNLIQNMSQLHMLECSDCELRGEGAHAFQPGLRSNRTLRELNVSCCKLGDDGTRLIAGSLVGNTTIKILDICINNISFHGLDNITRILEATRLHTIRVADRVFDNAASTHRFTRVLSTHEFLKNLTLWGCRLGDGGIHIIADALAGNAIIEFLDIGGNDITCVGLADITRLLLSSTRLKSIRFDWTPRLFNDVSATQHFVTTLCHKKSSVQDLPGNHPHLFPGNIRAAAFASITNSLIRNQQLNRVNLLLAPPQLQQPRNTVTMMLKISHKVITKFAMVSNNAGASAIFKLFYKSASNDRRVLLPLLFFVTAALQKQQKRRRLLKKI